jgi:cell division protein FtsB
MAEITELENQIKKLKEDVDYRHHRAMVAERG